MANWTAAAGSEPERVLRCPACKKELGRGQIVWVSMTCKSCGAKFEEIYRLRLCKR